MRIRLRLAAISIAPNPATSGTKEVRFRLDGVKRNYLVHAPDGLYRGKAVPLLLVLHGGGGTSKQILRSTGGRFNELADRAGFVVAYPNAVRRIGTSKRARSQADRGGAPVICPY